MDERTRTNVASYTVNEPIPVDALENGNEGTGVSSDHLIRLSGYSKLYNRKII